jgi:very-short-patch-repair endonuclease
MKRPPGYAMLQRAQRLRREMTPQEQILWGQLRGRRFEGAKFRRQVWLVGYVADFACPEARLVVEADGSQHADNAEYDAERERAFHDLGWTTLRFWNNEITENLDGVLTLIANALLSPSRPALPPAFPSPLKGEGELREPTPSPFRGEGGARPTQSDGRVRA